MGTSNLARIKVMAGWCVATVLLAGWSAHGQANPLGAAAAPAKPGAATQPTKMVFKKFTITDDQKFTGMPILRGVMPAAWTLKGGLTWKPGLVKPDLLRLHWGDAQDVSAFDMYPYIGFVWSNKCGPGGKYQVGQVVTGDIVKQPPSDMFDAFNQVIVQNFRPDLAKAKVVNKEKLTDEAKKIYAQSQVQGMQLMVAAGRETFEYDEHGQTVQEVLTGVYSMSGFSTPDPNQVRYWGVSYASSKRAVKGTLDSLTPIRDAMVQSMQSNPQWQNNVAQFVQQRQQQALAAQHQQLVNQQQWFNATENRISSEEQTNDAQHASYWQHSADLDRQSQNEADVQREVSPWTDGSGNTVKLPTTYGNAWSGADGQIIMSNDPSYNPASDPSLTSTQWTSMQQTHN